jgi:hypothetical protein
VIQEAAAKPGYDARVGYLRGSLPRWSEDGDQIEKGAMVLSGYALLAADRGQAEDACTDVWAMLQLADFLANEPVLSRHSSRLRIWQRAIENLEQLAATGNLPPAWNRKFAGRLAALNPAGDLARNVSAAGVMGGEIYFEGILNGSISFNTISPVTGFYIIPPNLGEQVWYRFHGVVRREYAEYIDWYREVAAAITEPGISLMALDQRLQDASARIAPDRKILSKLLPLASGVVAKGINETWAIRTKIAVAQVGLALERYRAEKGEYPPTLAALAPEYLSTVPADAATGKPLRYDLVPGGAKVLGSDIIRGAYLVHSNTMWLAGKTAE